MTGDRAVVFPDDASGRRGRSPISATWRDQPVAVRAGVYAVAAVVVLNLVALGFDAFSKQGEPSGPPSSSYATAPEGLAAYATLLERFGHPVERSGDRVDDLDAGTETTVILLDPETLLDSEMEALRDFVRSGRTLVVGGAGAPALRVLLPTPPRPSPIGITTGHALGPVRDTRGVRTVLAAGEGSWSAPGSSAPIVVGGRHILLTAGAIGAGRVFFLADPSPLQNRLLDHADNAALGLALAGEGTGPVMFVESVHGYGTGRGLEALPGSWRIALGGIGLAIFVFVLSRIRRLGPPEEPARPEPPPRRIYVDALAETLQRARDPYGAGEPLRDSARRLLAERARVPADAPPETIERAALDAELSPPAARALAAPGNTEDELVDAGRGVARLMERTK